MDANDNSANEPPPRPANGFGDSSPADGRADRPFDGRGDGRGDRPFDGGADGPSDGRADGHAEGPARGPSDGRADGHAEELTRGPADRPPAGPPEGCTAGPAASSLLNDSAGPSLSNGAPGSSPVQGSGSRDSAPRAGLAALSPRHQVAAVLALALIAVTACVHVGMLFLHVAPANTMTKQHGQVIDDWVYPEFEQNWKLFAPNPMQQNIAVQARAEIRTGDGTTRTTAWYDLSARDGAAIDGNLLPSHTQQNELRRAWDFYVAAHDAQNRPRGLRGQLAERYVRRIVMMRLDREESVGRGASIERVQVRSRTTNVPAPEWSDEKVATKPVLRQLPWWPVTPDDMPLGKARGSQGDAR